MRRSIMRRSMGVIWTWTIASLLAAPRSFEAATGAAWALAAKPSPAATINAVIVVRIVFSLVKFPLGGRPRRPKRQRNTAVASIGSSIRPRHDTKLSHAGEKRENNFV